MPNEHGQVTRDDFKAPEGKFRIVREEMSDGQLSIGADSIPDFGLAEIALQAFRDARSHDNWTLCDDKGALEDF